MHWCHTNVNNDISSDIYTGLPMVLSGLRWVDEKYSSTTPEDINTLEIIIFITSFIFNIT